MSKLSQCEKIFDPETKVILTRAAAVVCEHASFIEWFALLTVEMVLKSTYCLDVLNDHEIERLDFFRYEKNPIKDQRVDEIPKERHNKN